jgi:4-hydroxybenzoate polyprenyltransferase
LIGSTRARAPGRLSLGALSLGVLSFLRVKDWYYLTGIGALGYAYRLPRFRALELGFVLLNTALFLAHGYGFNYYGDLAAGERENKTRLDPRVWLLVSVVLLVAAVALSLIGRRPLQAALLVVGAIISFLYSSPTTRLKRRPLWNIFLNSSGFSVIFLVGYFANKRYEPVLLCMIGYIWFGIVPFQIIHLASHQSIERCWRLSSRASLLSFYLSHMIWIGYSVIVSILFYRGMIGLAALTGIYSLIQVVVLWMESPGRELSSDGATRVRRQMRWMNIVFGALLLILFTIT